MLLATSLVLWGCDEGLTGTGHTQDAPQVTKSTQGNKAPDMRSGAASATLANQQAGLSSDKQALNRKLRAVSLALAKALAEEETRQYVHSRALERFDGETNVLWQNLEGAEGMSALSGRKWNALIKRHLSPAKAGEMSKEGVESTIERAGELMSGPLHLYWAFADNFKASDERSPLVTFTPLGIDPDEITDVVAFDAQGKRHIVNESIARERPVVALTGNERTDAQGNVLARYAPEVGTNRLCGPGEDPPGCEEPPPPPPPCDGCGGGGDDDPHTVEIPDRSPGDTQYLYDSKLHEDVEGWLKHEPELILQLREPNGDFVDTGNNDLEFDHHENVGEWQQWRDRALFDWEPDDEGFYVTFDWHEDDGNNDDDVLGSATVNYGDSSTKHYFSYHNNNKMLEWTLRWD